MKLKKIILSAVFAAMVVAGVAMSEYFPDVIVTSPNGIWTDTRAYTSLDTALTAVGTNVRDLWIVREETITTTTIPATVNLHFSALGSMNVGTQLTINTVNIDAPNRQIFSGAGDIDFANGSVVKTGWFSNIAEAIDVTNDDSLTLVVTKQDYLTVSETLGTNVILAWESPNNRIIANAGTTLSNIRNIDAGRFQLFAGAGDFDFIDGTELRLSWFNRLKSVETWVEDEEISLSIDKDDILVSDVTLPDNISITNTNGSVITGAYTLTINGPIEAGNRQMFGTTTYVRLGERVGTANAGWFGLVNDGATNNTFALQNAINAISYGANKLLIPPGIYQYTKLYTYYDATLNPRFNSTTTTYGSPIIIEGSGCMMTNQFNSTTYAATSGIPGTTLRSTSTTGDCFNIGQGTPFADRKQASRQQIRNLNFFGETTGKIVNVGYSQNGFLMENISIGMKEDVAGKGLHINNAWGGTWRNVYIKSATADADVELGTTASYGLELDIYEEGYVDYLSGGNFEFENVSVNNFKFGMKLEGFNILMRNCNDYHCWAGVWIVDTLTATFINHYSELDYEKHFILDYGANVSILGGYFNLAEVAVTGIEIGNATDTYFMENVKIQDVWVTRIGTQTGASFIKKYANVHNVEISNIKAYFVADPFILANPSDNNDLMWVHDNSFETVIGAGWVFDKAKQVYAIGTTNDYSHLVNWDGAEGIHTGYGIYDVAVDGGTKDTVYSIGWIPNNATIIEASYEVITTFTDGADDSTEMALGVETNDTQGLIASTAVGAGTAWAAGYHDTLCDGAAANFTTKTSSAKNMIVTVNNDDDLIAGKMFVQWKYIMSE